MRLAVGLLGLIMLTQLNGEPVWVETTQLIIIRRHGTECGPGVGAVIVVGTRVLCVKETPDKIRERVKSVDEHG